MTAQRPRSDHSRLEVLSNADCLRLLQSVPLGRLVYTYGGLPAIRLVNFQVDDDTIVFNTGPGDKLRAAERGDVVGGGRDHQVRIDQVALVPGPLVLVQVRKFHLPANFVAVRLRVKGPRRIRTAGGCRGTAAAAP